MKHTSPFSKTSQRHACIKEKQKKYKFNINDVNEQLYKKMKGVCQYKTRKHFANMPCVFPSIWVFSSFDRFEEVYNSFDKFEETIGV